MAHSKIYYRVRTTVRVIFWTALIASPFIAQAIFFPIH